MQAWNFLYNHFDETVFALQNAAAEADQKHLLDHEHSMKNVKEMEAKLLDLERQRLEATERAMTAQNEVFSLQVVSCPKRAWS
jgi:hypothetical protein